MTNNEYYYAGLSFALSIVHGGPSPCFLSPVLYEAICCFIPRYIHVPFSEVPDEKWRLILMEVHNRP